MDNEHDDRTRDDMKEDNRMIVNTLLSYAQYCISCATADNTHHVLCSNFSSSEISEAKDELWKTMNYPEMKRTNSSKRSVDEANVGDIMDKLYKLDIVDDGPLFYVNPKGIGRLPRFNPENLNVVAMDQRLSEIVDQYHILQGQVDSYRTLAIRCNNQLDDHNTVLQQHTNALRELRKRSTTIMSTCRTSNSSPAVHDVKDAGDPKKQSNVESHATGNKIGLSSSMLNICVPTCLADKLSTVGAKTSFSSENTSPPCSKSPKANVNGSYASKFYSNQFKFNDMQPSTYFQSIPPAAQDKHLNNPSRRIQSEEEYKSFCAFSNAQTNDDRHPRQDDNVSIETHYKNGHGYQSNPHDRRRQRQNERRRNKVIYGTSTSLGSRFRGGPDIKDLSDIFVYHVASDVTVGDVKSHLKQEEITVQQLRIDITSNKDAIYKSFRIIAPGIYKDTLMNPEIWPVGVKVREYAARKPSYKHVAGKHTYGGGRCTH